MRTRLPALIAATLLTSLVLLGCGSSGGDSPDPTTTTRDEATTTTTAADDTTTTEAAASSEDLCAALKTISDFDARTAALVGQSASWAELQALFVSGTPTVLDAYSDAIAAAEGSIKDDLTTLRDYTEPTARLAEQSTSLIEFGTTLATQPGVDEAGVAGFNLDAYSRQNCGFGTSTSGN